VRAFSSPHVEDRNSTTASLPYHKFLDSKLEGGVAAYCSPVTGRGGTSCTAAAPKQGYSFLNITINIMHARDLPSDPPELPKLGAGGGGGGS